MAANVGEVILDYKNYPHSFGGCELSDLLKHFERLNATYIAECHKAIDASEQLDEATQRFCSFGRLLIRSLSNDSDLSEEDIALHFSILLGSSMEYALQLFLMVFEEDYQRSDWVVWEGFDADQVLDEFKVFLEELKEKDLVNSKQSKKLFRDIEPVVQKRKSMPTVSALMLGDLEGLFRSQKIFGDDDAKKHLYDRLATIRNGRNCVHTFSKAKANSFDAIGGLLSDYCKIVNDLLFRVHARNAGGIDFIAAIKARAVERGEKIVAMELPDGYQLVVIEP